MRVLMLIGSPFPNHEAAGWAILLLLINYPYIYPSYTERGSRYAPDSNNAGSIDAGNE